MEKTEQFWNAIRNDMVVTLATSSEGRVSMRAVSTVYYEGKILFFTSSKSKKFAQLQANPNCCIEAGGYFAEATAELCGAAMLDKNEKLREAYCKKFPGAFDEGVEFGGRDDDFVLLTPTLLSGWAFENDTPTPGGFPTVPFEIKLA